MDVKVLESMHAYFAQMDFSVKMEIVFHVIQDVTLVKIMINV